MASKTFAALREALGSQVVYEWFEYTHPEYDGMDEEAAARNLEGYAAGFGGAVEVLLGLEPGRLALAANRLILARIGRILSGEQEAMYDLFRARMDRIGERYPATREGKDAKYDDPEFLRAWRICDRYDPVYDPGLEPESIEEMRENAVRRIAELSEKTGAGRG